MNLRHAGRIPQLKRRLAVLAIALGCLPLPAAAAFDVNDEIVPHAEGWRPAYTTVPRVPAFTAAVSARGGPVVLTLDQIRAQFIAAGANWPVMWHRSSDFLVADHDWLRRFLEWQRYFHWRSDDRYRREVFDCDDFTVRMMAFADLALLRAGAPARPVLIGRLVVRSRHVWANIRAGGLHEVILCATDRGLHVVEPQNGTIIPLADYPNRTGFRMLVLN
ncbi:MAG: hypothetical protein HYV95_06135 [Opitutae bacterium]|nr:hypothetical protein [Opitutae bacterium]